MQTIINHHFLFGACCTKIAFRVCLLNRTAHTMFREVIKERKIKRILRINSKSEQTQILFSSDFALWIVCVYQSIRFPLCAIAPDRILSSLIYLIKNYWKNNKIAADCIGVTQLEAFGASSSFSFI